MTGLVKGFGPVAALAGVDLKVQPGEIAALLGPNGAGKSTLLRILATLVLPDEGTAVVAGHDVTRAPQEVRRAIGTALGDERSWHWRLTGRHNLEFFAALYGLTRRQAKLRANALLAEVGLTDAADRCFGGYSSGMKSRLSLARALIMSPRILILDEPTRALDPGAAAEFRRTLVELVSEHQAAVIMATHDVHEAAVVATEVLIVKNGVIRLRQKQGSDTESLEKTYLAVTGA